MNREQLDALASGYRGSLEAVQLANNKVLKDIMDELEIESLNRAVDAPFEDHGARQQSVLEVQVIRRLRDEIESRAKGSIDMPMENPFDEQGEDE